MSVHTSAYNVARAMKAALASVGVRKRTMAVRANMVLQVSLWKGLMLITALGLLGWLVFRALQLFGLG
ncbi:hypothetical protein GCM10010174_02420 [Kutzneria viridogrisea]|nr:hypothetical protein [Kutzneria viridogrisea]